MTDDERDLAEACELLKPLAEFGRNFQRDKADPKAHMAGHARMPTIGHCWRVVDLLERIESRKNQEQEPA